MCFALLEVLDPRSVALVSMANPTLLAAVTAMLLVPNPKRLVAG